MAKVKQALRPEFFTNLPTFAEQRAKEKGQTLEEELYRSLAQHQGWMHYKAYVLSLLDDLDQGTSQAMAQGLSFEEIGRNAVVIDIVKGIIRKSLNRVEDAQESNGKT